MYEICDKLQRTPEICSTNAESLPYSGEDKDDFWQLMKKYSVILIIVIFLEALFVAFWVMRKVTKDIEIEAKSKIKRAIGNLDLKKKGGNFQL